MVLGDRVNGKAEGYGRVELGQVPAVLKSEDLPPTVFGPLPTRIRHRGETVRLGGYWTFAERWVRVNWAAIMVIPLKNGFAVMGRLSCDGDRLVCWRLGGDRISGSRVVYEKLPWSGSSVGRAMD